MVELAVTNYEVTMVLIAMGSSVDLIFKENLDKMKANLRDVKPSSRSLTGFKGTLLSTIQLNVFTGEINSLRFVWLIISDGGSLWVAWHKSHSILHCNLWTIAASTCYSWT